MKTLIVMLLLFPLTAVTQDSITKKLTAVMQAYNATGHFNGSVLVAAHGNILLQTGFGLKNAEDKFNEADEKLKELGSILFQASITADIKIPPINGEGVVSKQVTVSFPNGQALVI